MRLFFAIIITLLLVASPDYAYAQKRSSSTVKKERQDASRRIKQTKKEIEANAKLTKSRLNDYNSLQADINSKTAAISTLNKKIVQIEKDIKVTSDSIAKLTSDVDRLRKSSAESLRQARAMRQSMTAEAMIFSSKDFTDAMKRANYLKQLDKSRNAKTRTLKSSIVALEKNKKKLADLRVQQEKSVTDLTAKQKALAAQQSEMEIVITELRKNGKALERELDKRQAKALELDRELDRIIAEEQRLAQIEEQKRIEAERQRKLEEERQLALKQEQERQERERILREQEELQKAQKRIAEEKAASAEKDKKQLERERKQAEKEAKKRKEELRRKEEERQRELRRQREQQKELANAEKAKPQPAAEPQPATPAPSAPKAELTGPQLSAAFVKNKGAMLFPVDGQHKVVSQFGRSTHANLSKVEVENAGIDIETSQGAKARAVFQGTVTSIFHLDGYHNIVMVRHGEYLTVYANVVDLAVKKGDVVRSGQAIGKVWADPDDGNRSILHFEVRKEREKLNPLEWVK